jgi:hypothetical protein
VSSTCCRIFITWHLVPCSVVKESAGIGAYVHVQSTNCCQTSLHGQWFLGLATLGAGSGSGSGMFYIRLRPSTAIGCGSSKAYDCPWLIVSHLLLHYCCRADSRPSGAAEYSL